MTETILKVLNSFTTSKLFFGCYESLKYQMFSHLFFRIHTELSITKSYGIIINHLEKWALTSLYKVRLRIGNKEPSETLVGRGNDTQDGCWSQSNT